jgi:hypothetical protein
MTGFLDRLAARAVGEAPLIHPRIRARHEPGSGVLPEGRVEEVVEKRAAEVAEARRGEPSPPRPPLPSPNPPLPGRGSATTQKTEDPDGRGFPLSRRGEGGRRERGPGGEDSAPRPSDFQSTFETPRSRPETVLEVSVETPAEEDRLRREPHPLAPSPIAHPSPGRGGTIPDPVRLDLDTETRITSLLSRKVGGDGRGGQGMRGHEAAQPAELTRTVERSASPAVPPAPPAPRRPEAKPEPAELLPRPLRRLAADLPTVEPERGAPLPPSMMEESEPSETVVHVSIGRIDVRATQPAAAERRPARPSGPRLSLADYLKGREERRR